MLAAIAIPGQLATAKLAGFPVEAGLYAFAAATIAFALFGANRIASAGADSTIAPIFAASVGALASAGSAEYQGLAAILALGVGAILIGVGLARAGWIADLLSVPVTTGILAGIAVHIVGGQLPSLFGIADAKGPFVLRVATIVSHLGHANPVTCALGIAVLGVTLLAASVSPRIPGALVGLAGAAVAVAAFDLQDRGVAVLGNLSVALPSLRLPPVPQLSQILALAPLALVVAAVCILQTAVVVRTYPADSGVAEDLAPDFAAIGAGNVVAGLIGAFPVNASPPSTAVVKAAGGRSQLSGLIAVLAVVLTVTLFSREAAYVPQAALAGVLISIAFRIFRARDMARIARYSRREIQLVITGALLVVVLPIQTGMLLAIMLSLAHGVSLVMWPTTTHLLRIRGSTIWWPATGERDVEDVPGILVFGPDAPINFTNAEYVCERLRLLMAQAAAPVKLLVIEGSGITDFDYTGSQRLQAAIAELQRSGVAVALARLTAPHHVFRSVEEAVETLNTSGKQPSGLP
jgi:MFS superfamily sulfate permease-like transporter